MKAQSCKFNAPWALLCASILIASATHQILAQVSDGDEQFQAYHGDIGRISGLSNGAQVAPQTTVVERARQHQQQAAASPSPVASVAPAAQRQQPSARGSRKPNRITLVARRDPLPSASAALAPLVATQPTPPIQHQHHQQHHQHQNQASQPTSSSSPSSSPASLITDSTYSAPQQSPSSFQAPSPPVYQAGPALASFQGGAAHSPSLSTSVSARHSALMAEVAAERANQQHQQQQQQQQQNQQPSLGSPLEALSSPLQVISQAAPQLPQSPGPSASAYQQAQPAIESPTFIAASQAEEPLPAPSFEQVLSSGCPHKGVFSWENKDLCDRYYMCTNGTFTEEACPNGLAYSRTGAVYQHCAYNWNVDCGRKKGAEPIASPGCPWQFGIFPILQNGRCSIDYYACEWGVPEPKRCSPEGLFYDDRIKGCQWADQLGCKSEALLNFKCPAEDEDNPYWPYPRYYHTNQDVIVCVNEQPRLVHCTEEQLVEPSSLACVDVKKKKKF